MKVENSIWRCTVPVTGSETGECDVTLIQHEMEEHLRRSHPHIPAMTPLVAVQHFVLVRTSEIARGPGRRPAVKDETMPMFEKGVDFR